MVRISSRPGAGGRAGQGPVDGCGGQGPRVSVCTVRTVPPWWSGCRCPQVGAEFYEVAPLTELDGILRLLSGILLGGALLATAAGAGLGAWASRSVVTPLNRVATTAAAIAGGQLGSRLPATLDPELATIVASFNSMVDTLQQRIERDARLAADVSHELRSPLTTLVGSVDLLNARREDLHPRSRRALDLVTADLDRFRRLLDRLARVGSIRRRARCAARRSGRAGSACCGMF